MSADLRAEYRTVGRLSVARALSDFVEREALFDSRIDAAAFWSGLDAMVHELAPQTRALLEARSARRRRLDAWHLDQRGAPLNAQAYEAFLRETGYLTPDTDEPVAIETEGLAPEIRLAAPQTAAPASIAMSAITAVNARWGGLYAALYASDAIPMTGGGRLTPEHNPIRAARAIAWTKELLDTVAPLSRGRHRDATAYRIAEGALSVEIGGAPIAALADPAQLIGFRGQAEEPRAALLAHRGLHIELRFDRTHRFGAQDEAGIAELAIEAAATAVIDFDDGAVIASTDDQVRAYRAWLGLQRGDLEAGAPGDAPTRPNEDRLFTSPRDGEVRVPGRALAMARIAGAERAAPSVLDAEGRAIPAEILDVMVLAAMAGHELAEGGALYLVKPRIDGPEEAAYVEALLARAETALELPSNALKLGFTVEARRAAANLRECVRPLRRRVFLIGDGGENRAADEIDAGFEAGPMRRLSDLQSAPWAKADAARQIGFALDSGLGGRGQILRGAWDAPDRMAALLQQATAWAEAGASSVRAPTPHAAALLATVFHRIDIAARQHAAAVAFRPADPEISLRALLTPPLMAGPSWSPEEIEAETDAAAHLLLRAAAAAIEKGRGRVIAPDQDDARRLSTLASLRLAVRLLANWRWQGVISEPQLRASLQRMADLMTADASVLDAVLELTVGAAPADAIEPILRRRREQP